MTQREWEQRLLRNLKQLPEAERETIADYYREIYGDKMEAGHKHEAILKEFGSPEECAARILSEETPESFLKKEKKKAASPGFLVGLFFLTLLLILPLVAVAFSLVAAFAACTAAGFALTIGGVGIIVLGAFQPTGATVLSTVGIGLAAIGAGIGIALLFYFLTKLLTLSTVKLLRRIYGRRTGGL